MTGVSSINCRIVRYKLHKTQDPARHSCHPIGPPWSRKGSRPPLPCKVFLHVCSVHTILIKLCRARRSQDKNGHLSSDSLGLFLSYVVTTPKALALWRPRLYRGFTKENLAAADELVQCESRMPEPSDTSSFRRLTSLVDPDTQPCSTANEGPRWRW